MKENIDLKAVAVEYLKENGELMIADLDTPSFIRKEFNLVYRETKSKKISSEVPGRISRLLDVLFGDEEVSFA